MTAHQIYLTVATTFCLILGVAAIDKLWTQQWTMATIYALGCIVGLEFIRQLRYNKTRLGL